LRAVGDGGSVIGSGPDGVVWIETADRRVAWVVAEPEDCWNLGVVREADAVFCGDHCGRIDVRDLSTGTVRATLKGQNGTTGTLWEATDGTELVSFANNEPVVSRWRLDGSRPVTCVIAPGWPPDRSVQTVA
jgi:hypothetical protein